MWNFDKDFVFLIGSLKLDVFFGTSHYWLELGLT